MVVTGTSMDKGDKSGKLVFFQKDNFEKVLEMEVESLWNLGGLFEGLYYWSRLFAAAPSSPSPANKGPFLR